MAGPRRDEATFLIASACWLFLGPVLGRSAARGLFAKRAALHLDSTLLTPFDAARALRGKALVHLPFYGCVAALLGASVYSWLCLLAQAWFSGPGFRGAFSPALTKLGLALAGAAIAFNWTLGAHFRECQFALPDDSEWLMGCFAPMATLGRAFFYVFFPVLCAFAGVDFGPGYLIVASELFVARWRRDALRILWEEAPVELRLALAKDDRARAERA